MNKITDLIILPPPLTKKITTSYHWKEEVKPKVMLYLVKENA